MSDYTHDDAMIDLGYLAEYPGDSAAANFRRLDAVVAYIERLEAECYAFWTQALEGMSPQITPNYVKHLRSEVERLEAENTRLREAYQTEVDYLEEANRNQWEAVARWLAEHGDAWSGGVEYAIDRAREAVRHE